MYSYADAQNQRLRIMEYNVENLFDTLHAEGKADYEFTPQSKRRWNTPRYWSKQVKLSKVIAAVGGLTPPDLVALIEVENDTVVNHLINRTKLWRLGYQYICTQSADTRGLNVALLYLPHRFRPIITHTLRIPPTSHKLAFTRDVLHVAGELTTGDTLDLLICHFPSRRNGKLSERYRNQVAQNVRRYTDSLMTKRQNPAIILTGDFNTWYPEDCLKLHFGVQLLETNNIQPHTLYILSHQLQATHNIRGTYKFRGEWNQLDHFIVNGALLQPPSHSRALHIQKKACRIADFKFLLQHERNGEGVRPRRSFLGNFYQGGYSDHLPLVLDLNF